MTEHVTAETLADHAEGLLPSSQAAEVAQHLLTCAPCRELRAALGEVSTLLTAYADPGPMPADVADRLDTALRSADPLGVSDADEEAEETGTSTTVLPAAGTKGLRTPLSSRVLQVAALVVLIVAGAGIAFSSLLGGDGTRSSSAGGAADSATAPKAGSAQAAGTRVTTTGTTYSQQDLGTLGAALARGSLLASGPALTSRSPGAAASDGSDSSASPPGSARALAPDDLRLVTDPAARASCVAQLAGKEVTPLAVDVGTWVGQPATVIVLPVEGDPTSIDVYAVRPDCAPGFFLGFAHLAR